MKKKLFVVGMLMAALCVNPLRVSAKDISVGEDFTGTESFVYEGHVIEEDYEGNKCIVLFFNYTNQNDEASMAGNDYWIQAFQNGIQLDSTGVKNESQYEEIYENTSRMIKKGISLEVAFAYVLQDNSLVDFSIQENANSNMLAENLTIDISSETGDFVSKKGYGNGDVTEQLEEKNKEIEELNKQLEEKDKEIAQLKSELDEAKKTTKNVEEGESADSSEDNNGEDSDTEENGEKESTSEVEQKPVVEYKDATTIRIVQQSLNDAGYNCGNPDGVAGGKTTEAVTKYQTDKGLTVNGLVTDELLQALNIVEKVQDAVQKEASKGEYGGDYTYDQLARNPDTYKNQKIKISGKVLQAEYDDDICYARIAMNNDYNTVVFVTYSSDLLNYRLLEDDKVTVYGVSYGVYSYKAVSGATITIPWLSADMIEM